MDGQLTSALDTVTDKFRALRGREGAMVEDALIGALCDVATRVPTLVEAAILDTAIMTCRHRNMGVKSEDLALIIACCVNCRQLLDAGQAL